MNPALTDAVSGIMHVFYKIAQFVFQHPYPGLTITIGGVLVGCFMIDWGFDLLRYFLNSKGSSIREGGSK